MGLHLNVWNGCQNPVRRARLASWLREMRPDVLTLNELNGWDATSLAAFAHDVHLPHSAFMSTAKQATGNRDNNNKAAYHLGVLSRVPVRIIAKHSAGFRHGALHVAVDELLDVVVTHLTPAGPRATLQEARELLRLVGGNATPAPIIIAGDLNSLARTDLDA